MAENTTQADKARRNRRIVAAWLFSICALLALMVVVGGATRLTNSGLSITEWRPITGALPPLSVADWQEEFAKYQKIPQYRLVNRGMSIEEFKGIYWWEWSHRLLGRIIGFVFIVPFVVLMLLRILGRHLVRRLVLIFALGAAQAVLGWYMVQSGLADRVQVSQYRLAGHLALAFVILGMTLWLALDVLRPSQGMDSQPRWFRPASIGLSGFVFCQVVVGAFVAGLRAGYRFNDWPLMEGRIVPSGLAAFSPLWRNLFENPATVQFAHRLLAYVILIGTLALWFWMRPRTKTNTSKRALDLALAAVAVQVLLGIWTLVAVVPLALGLLHQAGALALFAASVNLMHAATPRTAVQQRSQAASPSAGAPTRSLDTGSSQP